jgi:hypothetical protein
VDIQSGGSPFSLGGAHTGERPSFNTFRFPEETTRKYSSVYQWPKLLPGQQYHLSLWKGERGFFTAGKINTARAPQQKPFARPIRD